MSDMSAGFMEGMSAYCVIVWVCDLRRSVENDIYGLIGI